MTRSSPSPVISAQRFDVSEMNPCSPYRVIARLIAVTITGLLAAQDSQVVVDIPIDAGTAGDSGKSDPVQVLTSLRESYGEAGDLGAVLTCVAVETIPGRSDAIRTLWSVSGSSPFLIDSVVVIGGDPAVRRAVRRLLGPMKSRVASAKSLSKATGILNPYVFLPEGERPGYATFGDQRVALVVPINETAHNTVMGMVGFQPHSEGSRGIAGEVKLHLERLFGTASRSDIFWVRTNQFSQSFSLSHEELYLWRLNFGGRMRFYQDLNEGLYVARRTELALVAPWSRWGKLSLGAERTRVSVTTLGKEMGMRDHRIRSIFMENERDSRDAFWNPSQGTLIQARAAAGYHSRSGDPSAMLLRLSLKAEVVRPLSHKWAFAIGGTGGYVHIQGGASVPASELFQYGGASSLRGYRENQFFSRGVAIVQLEWRYRLQGANRITLFVDGALPHGSQTPPVAAGAGIQQRIPLGILRLEYAVSREDRFSEGKVHLRLLGRF